MDYKRQRNGSTKDDWQVNTFSDVNTYTKVERGAGDWLPDANNRGSNTQDDTNTVKGYCYAYDAWERLVTVKDAVGTVLVEAFRYNGLGQRIAWHYDTDADLDVDGSDDWYYFQYNEKWQQVGMWKAGDTAPKEVFVYRNAGLDGYGGSSYIDDVVLRERDEDNDGDLDQRLYYLQNWRHDVSALITIDGVIKEKVIYDAYGRPHSFSPGDISDGTNNRPDGLMNSTDTGAWSSGSVAWNKDIGNSSDVAAPDGTVDSNDSDTLKNLEGTFTGGWDLLGDSTVGNRKGYAGYDFDTILQGAGTVDEKPVYHVRTRVLASDTGKWFQRDPLGYHDSMDLFEYCASDPEDRRDPMGLACSSKQTCGAVSSTSIQNLGASYSEITVADAGGARIPPPIVFNNCQLPNGVAGHPWRDLVPLWWSDPTTRLFIGQAQAACLGKCSSITVSCNPGCTYGSSSGPPNCQITIPIGCPDPWGNGHQDIPLRHELTHMTDYCLYGEPRGCSEIICREVHAYHASGECHMRVPGFQEGDGSCCDRACASIMGMQGFPCYGSHTACMSMCENMRRSNECTSYGQLRPRVIPPPSR